MARLVTTGPTRNLRTQVAALIAAVMLVIMILAQLFGYEDFATILSDSLPQADQAFTTVLAAGLVLAEISALPYLLGMYTSKLLRIASAVMAGGVCGFWLVLAFTNAHAQSSGLFSSTLDVPGGILAALWSALLVGTYVRVLVSDSRFVHDATS